MSDATSGKIIAATGSSIFGFVNHLNLVWLIWSSRAGRAWRYFRNETTAEDAMMLMLHAENRLQIWCLEALTANDVWSDACKRFQPDPRLADYARRAAVMTARGWSPNFGVAADARASALELIARLACEDGEELIERALGASPKQAMPRMS